MLLFLLIVVVVVILPTVVALRALRRIHPARRRLIDAAALLCNIFWLTIPLLILSRTSAITRMLRSTLGPPWFTWIVFAFLYTLFVAVTAGAWMVSRRRVSFSRFAHGPSVVFLLLLALFLAYGVYGALVPIDVRKVSIALADLPPDLDGFRIAQMSDLHVGMFSRTSRLREFVAVANRAHPDIVIVSGDLVDDDPYFAPKMVGAFSSLDPRIPLYGVLGNHEMYGDPDRVIASLRGSRMRLLVNEGLALRRGAATLWLAGLSDFAATETTLRPDLAKAMRGAAAGSFPLVVAHQPKAFELTRDAGLPLLLCGHSHGGQCGIRRVHWSLAGLFLRYHMGLYRDGASQVYVNTGTGFWLVPIRLGLAGEITVIELHRRPAVAGSRPLHSGTAGHRRAQELPSPKPSSKERPSKEP